MKIEKKLTFCEIKFIATDEINVTPDHHRPPKGSLEPSLITPGLNVSKFMTFMV